MLVIGSEEFETGRVSLENVTSLLNRENRLDARDRIFDMPLRDDSCFGFGIRCHGLTVFGVAVSSIKRHGDVGDSKSVAPQSPFPSAHWHAFI
jgi:hypothetical protein